MAVKSRSVKAKPARGKPAKTQPAKQRFVKVAPGKAKGKQGIKTAKTPRNMPVKRTINLAQVEEKKIGLSRALIGILLIVGLAAVFSKFLVTDRLSAMSQASGIASQKKADVDRLYEAINTYEGVEDTYAHYTFADMTKDELSLVDRSLVLEMMKTVFPADQTSAWSLTGNILTIEVSVDSLNRLNELTRQMEENPIVDTCTVSTANRTISTTQTNRSNSFFKEEDALVRARMVIYLHQPPAEEEEEP